MVQEKDKKLLGKGMKNGQMALNGRNHLGDSLGETEEKYILPALTATEV